MNIPFKKKLLRPTDNQEKLLIELDETFIDIKDPP